MTNNEQQTRPKTCQQHNKAGNDSKRKYWKRPIMAQDTFRHISMDKSNQKSPFCQEPQGLSSLVLNPPSISCQRLFDHVFRNPMLEIREALLSSCHSCWSWSLHFFKQTILVKDILGVPTKGRTMQMSERTGQISKRMLVEILNLRMKKTLGPKRGRPLHLKPLFLTPCN